MAGRKKQGNLADPIGVRLDSTILPLVEQVIQEAPLAKGEAVEVIRVITTWWLMNRDALKLADDFGRIAARGRLGESLAD